MPNGAVLILTIFEVLKSLVFNWGSAFLFYVVIIPVLHVAFFSVIYLATGRLGASLGIHVGANFITISIFDLRIEQPNQAIPAGLFEAQTELEELSMHALQIPWVIMASLFCIVTYVWWIKKIKRSNAMNKTSSV